jgi:hypothetical protein
MLCAVGAALAAWFWGPAAALAVVAAGAVAAGDLAIMAVAVGRLSQGRLRSRVFYTVVLGIKFPALIGIVYLLVVVLELDVVGLMIGFATLVVAILYAAVSYQKMLMEGGEE